MKHALTLAAAAALGALSAGATAQAATISGGITDVTVTADLAGLGLGGAPFGSASVTPPATFMFPITGGTVDDDTGAAIIEHEGSGVTLATLDDTDDVEVTVGNFVIDTGLATVFGDVIGGPEGLDLFAFSDDDLDFADGIDLDITGTLAGALTSVFGAPDLTGAQFGVAVTSPELAPIPLPASAWMLLAGLGGMGVMARRRRKAA
ncbi:MAG: VPLPA-CTERM sorting domain-containing protein [Pseudomonadota bacterium]